MSAVHFIVAEELVEFVQFGSNLFQETFGQVHRFRGHIGVDSAQLDVSEAQARTGEFIQNIENHFTLAKHE